MLSMIQNGWRPERPTQDNGDRMEDAIWEIVQACWQEKPESRPSAGHLVHRLHALGYTAI